MEELKDPEMKEEEFTKLSGLRSGMEVPQLITRANAIIVNDGDQTLLMERLDAIMKDWDL